MKTQTKIITYLIAILMLLQPLMVTVAYATEAVETEVEVVTETGLKTITIGDKALYEALKKHLGNKASYVDSENAIDIYIEDLNSVTELKLEDSEISDLSGIENFTELTSLDVSGNNLTTNSGLDKINSLTKLTYLDLSRNQIEDVSQISSLLNKSGFNLDIDQDIKIIDFVSIIPQPEEYEDAENILINDLKETIDLPQILFAYENMTINIEELRAAGTKIDKSEFEDYVEIKDGKIRILKRSVNNYELKLKLTGDLPNHGTTCQIKAFRIDTENQEGIVFKDENLYKAIKEKYEIALGIKGANSFGIYDYNFIGYDEWNDYEFVASSREQWEFDDENLIIIANKKDLRKIESVTVYNAGISDLTGIEKFIGVESLSFENNLIKDVNLIIELNKNKKKVTEEYKQKFNEYVEKISILLSEYNDLQAQIEVIDKEIEELRKAIANGEEITDRETTEDKNERRKKILKEQAQKKNLIVDIIYTIEEFVDSDEEKGISVLLTSPSLKNEIEKLCEEIDSTDYNIIEQKEIIENNKLIEFTNKMNSILDNLTDKELEILRDKEFLGGNIIEEQLILNAEAKFAIEHLKNHIDQTNDTELLNLIEDFNDIIKSKITSTNNEGKQKEASVLRNELKLALDRYFDSENEIDASDIIVLFEVVTDILEEQLFIQAKDSIISIIKENISYFASEISEEIIEDLKLNITEYIFNLEEMQRQNRQIIKNKLMPAYEEIYELINSLQIAFEQNTNFYLLNHDNLMRIITRLQNITDEDINTVIKVPDLIKVTLNSNLISNADRLSEIETLEVLELSNNYISNFDFSKFQNIEQLYLDSNSIRNPEITEMKNIKILDLSYNWIDDTSKITLSGMPKLQELRLDNNKIDDVEHLINSKVGNLSYYETVGEYWQSGASKLIKIVSIDSQKIILNLKIHTDKTEAEVSLPKIFSQMKEIETTDLVVTYDKELPCLNVYNDGTKAILDTSIRNVNNKAEIFMTAGDLGTITCEINYIVVDDETAPTISAVAGVSEEFTNGEVTLTIEGAADDGVGLATRPYSFDGGATWQVSNTKTFTENTENIVIKVRDLEGNEYVHEPISITTIDKTAPVVAVNKSIVDAETGKSSVTVEITETESGLSDENKYEYYLSTSRDEKVDGTAVEFVPGTAFEVGEGLEGTYYMFVNIVSDKVGNVSEAIKPVEFTFVILDKTNPTITEVAGNPENWTNENVTITIEGAADDRALDNEAYSFDGGNSWQAFNTKTYTQNTENIEILVRDAAGNVYTHEKVNISKIDKVAPEVNANVETTEDGTAKITITATDAESGLAEANEYKYNVSTSKDELTSEEWTEYKSGETFEIGEELEDGTYYVTVKSLKDNANNEKEISPIEVTLETKEQEQPTDSEDEKETLEYLTLGGITKLIRAYITDDYSTLPESFMVLAGDNGTFELEEITKTIRLFLSL